MNRIFQSSSPSASLPASHADDVWLNTLCHKLAEHIKFLRELKKGQVPAPAGANRLTRLAGPAACESQRLRLGTCPLTRRRPALGVAPRRLNFLQFNPFAGRS